MYKIFDSLLNWKDISVTNIEIFEKKQFSLQIFFSLLQVYMVYMVSFIFRLNASLLTVCTYKGFAYLLCWPRGRGRWLVCTRRFPFHESYLIFIIIFFWKLFFPHDIYPHPWPTTSTHYTPCCRRRTFSFVRAVAQAVPAATSQIHRRHMRTRLSGDCKSQEKLKTMLIQNFEGTTTSIMVFSKRPIERKVP